MSHPCLEPLARAGDARDDHVSGYDVPPEQWGAFLRRFAERHAGAPVGIVLSTKGSAELARGRRRGPFHGARHTSRTDGCGEILITVGEPPYMLEPYFVVDPVLIRVEHPEDGKLVIRIEAKSGVVLVLLFGKTVGRRTGPLTLVG